MKSRYNVIVIDYRNFWCMFYSVEGGLNHNPLYAQTFDNPDDAFAIAVILRDRFHAAYPIKVS